MNTRNAVHNDDGTIDCEIEHPNHGWIPFTASADDVEQLGKDIYAALSVSQGVSPYVPPTPAVKMARTLLMVRDRRDSLLAACDWTHGSDSPLSVDQKALWATYRQELRDFPATITDPDVVVWPTPPT